MIPLIFLIAMIVISYVMYKEDNPVIVTDNEFILTDEQVGKIEASVQYAVKHYKPHWKMQYRGHFNTAHYVKYLEYKASKKSEGNGKWND